MKLAAVWLVSCSMQGMQGLAVFCRAIEQQGASVPPARRDHWSCVAGTIFPVFRPVCGVYDTQRDRLAKPNLNINSLPLQLPTPDCVLCCVLRRGDQQDGAVLQAGQDGAGGGPAASRDPQVGGSVLSGQSGANICTAPGWSGGCAVCWLW